MVAEIFRDVRHALRAIRRMPGVATVVVLSLTVGIGVNATVFSWIQARVLYPIAGVRRSGQFLLVEPRGERGSYPGMSWLEYRDLSDRLTSFGDLIASRSIPVSVGSSDWPERTPGMLVSGNYFRALGLSAAAGRLIDDSDTARPGGDSVVVISHDFWRTRFGGSPTAVGQTLRLNDRPVTVIGVAPAGFEGTMMGLAFHLWMPATLAPVLLDGSRELENRAQRGYSALGRLGSGVTRNRAQRELDRAMAELARAYPNTNATVTGEILPFWQSPRGPQRFMTSALATLQAAMLLILFAVCLNTANLLLARASARRREMSVRLAIGAGRARLVRLVLVEHVMLALLGSLAGAALAVWGTDALRAVPMPTPGGFQITFHTAVDGLTLAFAMLLGLASGVAFGLPTALQLARVDPQSALRGGAHSTGRSRLHDVIMLTEVALALLVLIVAGMFVRSFLETRSIDPGFRREGVVLGAYDLRGRSRNVDAVSARSFAARLLSEVRAVPRVEAAAIAAAVPLDIHGMPVRFFAIEGRRRADGELDQAAANTVTPGYFATMGIPFVTGHDFADLTDANAAAQAIVNEEFVNRFLQESEPLGQRLELLGSRVTIVGVVPNTLVNAFGEPATPMLYLALRDRPSPQGEIHVRTRPGSESLVVPDLRRVLRHIDPTVPLYNVRTLTDHVETNLVFRRIPARMFAVLGPLLLGLAALGIYAVVAYTVSRRRAEIGMRMALGATPGRVVAGFVGETLRVVGLGALAGWVLALLIDRDASGAGGFDPVVFIGVPTVLIAVAALAAWIPSHRASQLDPVSALREQ
jgi:putative ABC transport system permease protein